MTTIDRNGWGRGLGWEDSKLYNPNTDKRCCLGYFCEQKGIQLEELADKSDPNTLEPLPDSMNVCERFPQIAKLFNVIEGASFHRAETNDLMLVNDAEIGQHLKFSTISNTVLESEDHREVLIKILFSKLGEEVQFVN